MCGIAGLCHFDPGQRADPELVRRMTRLLAHRGPDDEGLYAAGPAALGNRRLSIIDVEGGHQPLARHAAGDLDLALLVAAGDRVSSPALDRVRQECARRLGLDPVEIRRRNLIPPDAFPYRTALGAVRVLCVRYEILGLYQ